jgi:hypothetical protein
MDEVNRFVDPWDAYGLRAWRYGARSRLIARLKNIPAKKTIPWRRGFFILRDLLGEDLDRVDSLELSYAFQRLLVLDWLTGFKALGFFTEGEIRDYALLCAPPQDSVLGHFWYGLLAGESPRDIERVYRRQTAAAVGRRRAKLYSMSYPRPGEYE